MLVLEKSQLGQLLWSFKSRATTCAPYPQGSELEKNLTFSSYPRGPSFQVQFRFSGDGCVTGEGLLQTFLDTGYSWQERTSLNMLGLVRTGSGLEGVGKECTRETFSSVHCFGTGF